MDLAGRVALVTGASSGIGRAIALALAERGARLLLTARRRERLDALAQEIISAGGEAEAAAADLRDEASLQAAFEAAVRRFGGLDILINNAGLGRLASLHDGDTEDWREMLEVNVLGLSIATREALGRFPDEGGHIVNISSMSGHRVTPGGGMYAASKFAVRALTEGLRTELRAKGSKTKVSAISPGFVATEFFQVLTGDPAQAKAMISQYPVLQPEDIARSVIHVLEAPAQVTIHDLLVRPAQQPS